MNLEGAAEASSSPALLVRKERVKPPEMTASSSNLGDTRNCCPMRIKESQQFVRQDYPEAAKTPGERNSRNKFHYVISSVHRRLLTGDLLKPDRLERVDLGCEVSLCVHQPLSNTRAYA